MASICVHHVDLEGAASIAIEGDPLAVRRPGGLAVRGGVLRQAALAASVGVHDVDIGIAVAQAVERDPASVRRPRGRAIALRIVRQPTRVGAVGVHGVDVEVAVAVARERDPPVGRPGRVQVAPVRNGCWKLLSGRVPRGPVEVDSASHKQEQHKQPREHQHNSHRVPPRRAHACCSPSITRACIGSSDRRPLPHTSEWTAPALAALDLTIKPGAVPRGTVRLGEGVCLRHSPAWLSPCRV